MLGERIAELRKSKGISQEELADVLVTSRQAISKWERGESDPDVARLKDLAVYFGVSIDYLLGYDVETTSVNNFINRLNESKETGVYDTSLDEIKVVVHRNNNNLNLILAVIEYLGEYCLIKHDDKALDLTIEYLKKAILLYRPDNSLNVTLNDLHQYIANSYTMKERYDLAKKHLIDNHVIGGEMLMAQCEFELGHYPETENLTSKIFLNAISDLINSNMLQIRLFLRTKKEKEAIDLAEWSISFIKSIGKNEELFIDIIFILNFVKAACEKILGLDYSTSLKYLKENSNKTLGYRGDRDGLKFYNNQRITISSRVGDIKQDLYQEIQLLKSNSVGYKCALDIYNEIYKGD